MSELVVWILASLLVGFWLGVSAIAFTATQYTVDRLQKLVDMKASSTQHIQRPGEEQRLYVSNATLQLNAEQMLANLTDDHWRQLREKGECWYDDKELGFHRIGIIMVRGKL